MDLLVLHPESQKKRLQTLKPQLDAAGVRWSAYQFPKTWSIAESGPLLERLYACSHVLLVVDQADTVHPAFLFVSGYCVARSERCFLWTKTKLLPDAWHGRMVGATKVADLLVHLAVEERRWSALLARQDAERQLVARGFEVTPSAFWETVEKGDAGSVEQFLHAGFNPGSTNRKGVTMLGLSVRNSHWSVLRVLLAHGADINQKSTDRDNTPLMDAAAEGHLEMAQELIERGADLAPQSRNGQNALVLAIGKGADPVSALLLKAGADPFAADKLGMDALGYARLFGRKDVLELVAALYPGRA